ncbi:hypothetical protein ABIB00_007429 [Bradyrhizobium sp. LB14.3]
MTGMYAAIGVAMPAQNIGNLDDGLLERVSERVMTRIPLRISRP